MLFGDTVEIGIDNGVFWRLFDDVSADKQFATLRIVHELPCDNQHDTNASHKRFL